MTTGTLVRRNLTHFWRTNLAVLAGVAIAVSSLSGALLVGDSVRGSLRDLAVARLGRVDHLVAGQTIFTDALASRLEKTAGFGVAWSAAVPVLALEGVVFHEKSGERAGSVQVFGVDDRFWRLNGAEGVTGPAQRTAFLSAALARELNAATGDALLLRVQKPSAIPAGVLQGRKDDPGKAVRLTVNRVLSRAQAGDFSPRMQQGDARTLFVAIDRLQRDMELSGRANMILVSAAASGPGATAALTSLVEREVRLDDLGVRVRSLRDGIVTVESSAGYLSDGIARGVSEAIREAGAEPIPVLTYLATAIKANGHETPYSLVSSLPESAIAREAVPGRLEPAPTKKDQPPSPLPVGAGFSRPGTTTNRPGSPPIWLSQWTADDLAAHAGDAVTLDYYLWSDTNGLSTASETFTLAGILPMSGLGIDRDLTPDYPGVSTTEAMADWDPPFPVDLTKVRKKDEDYWHQYRTAPKAFLRIEDGQRLWKSRYGQATSIRVSTSATEFGAALQASLPKHLPPALGEFRAIAVRADALAAAAGTTDFGEYFTYFSFFVVVASLLLTMLFFRLGVEQRAAEIGTLGALGYPPRAIARIFLIEGFALAIVGALLGTAGAIGYAALIMLALRTIWIGAVGTTELSVHPSAVPLIIGAVSGIVAAGLCVLWSLRAMGRSSARRLMSGGWLDDSGPARRPFRPIWLAIACLATALALVIGAAAQLVDPVVGFFGSGTLLLIGGLSALAAWLRASSSRAFTAGRLPLVRFGIRNARYRPSRSTLSAALIASATFLIVSVGAFQLTAGDSTDPHSGTGGYALVGETVVPLMRDPATAAGRDALGLSADLAGIDVARFRLRPGDDTSCANLYRPTNPRLLGATDEFIRAGRFSFSSSIATNADEQANPWLLLHRPLGDRIIPVVGDATSLSYSLHLSVGDDFVIDGPDGKPLTLRIMAALRDSILQSELVMSDAQFTRWFPRNEGFRVFLISNPKSQIPNPKSEQNPKAQIPTPNARSLESGAISKALEDQLADFGMDVQSASDRLASYHRVENTFLSTFQALGALGLVLGTFGLGTVLLRNVLERRRELAVLRATGYRRSHLVATVIAESVFLLACGLALGVVCALIAIGPAYAERGEGIPVAATLGLLGAVMISGLLSTILATHAVASSDLLPALKNE